MSKMRLLAALSLILVLCTAAVRAEEPAVEQPAAGQATEATLDVLLNAIRSNRKALVAVNLGLSDEKAAKFWPLYDRYQAEVNAVGDRLAAVVEDYTKNFASLSDDKALSLIGEYLSAEADRARLRNDYISQFAAILNGRTVARLYQIENKMDAILRYDLAATIPVVEEHSATAPQ